MGPMCISDGTQIGTDVACWGGNFANSYILTDACDEPDCRDLSAYATFTGESGKLSFSTDGDVPTANGYNPNFIPFSMEIGLDAIREQKLERGKWIDNSHTLESLAKEALYDLTEWDKGQDGFGVKFQGLNAMELRLHVTLSNGAELTVKFYLMCQPGQIKNGPTGDEEYTRVERGSLKFSVDLINWPFCSNQEAIKAAGVHPKDVSSDPRYCPEKSKQKTEDGERVEIVWIMSRDGAQPYSVVNNDRTFVMTTIDDDLNLNQVSITTSNWANSAINGWLPLSEDPDVVIAGSRFELFVHIP